MTTPSRTSWRLFGGTTLLAFALRAAQVLLMSNQAVNPHWLHPVMDAAVYDGMARGLLAGTWPAAGEPFFSAPLYPYLLGAFYGVLGTGHMLPVMLVHAFLSALGAGFAALIAARLWGARAGWLAGVLYAGSWVSILFAAELLAVSVTVPLLLAALWLLLRAMPADGAPAPRLGLLLAGLGLGLACTARPNLLVLAPVWIWYVVHHRRVGWRSPRWLPLAAGLGLAILPVTAHNLVRGGAAVLIANSGGVNFYIGNHAGADGASVSLPDVPPSRADMPANLTRAAESETGRLLDPVAVDRHFLQKGLRFWAEHPGAALGLQVRKLGLLVAMRERSNTKHLYFWRQRSALLRWPIWLGFTPILLLAVVGLWRRDLDPGVRFLILGSALAFGLALTLFFVNGRFRLPLLALLVVPAAGGLDWLWASWRSRRWAWPRPLLAALVALAAVSVVPDLLAYDPRAGFGDPAIWYSLGNGYLAAGDDPRAIDAYRQAVRQQQARPQPTFAPLVEPLHASLGDLLVRNGRVNEALQLYQNWLRSDPGSAEAAVRLGDLLLQTGRIDDAAGVFATVLARTPDQPGARLGQAWVQLYRGQAADALATFDAIHAAAPNAHARFGAGLALMQLDRLDEAERAFREVLVIEPGYWQAWGNLGDLYDRQGRLDKAAEAFQKVLEINPQDQGARTWLRAHPQARR
ncbi:MAG: tetratricopeptide repeat protein [Candidatus Krumholzibacteriia bacterium]